MVRTVHRGQYVEVEFVLLEPENRSPKLPEDTAALPYVVRVRGFLINEQARVGETVKILTIIDRVVEGKLLAVNPPYIHNFGGPVPEILKIGRELREML